MDATNFANKRGGKSGFDSLCKECKKNPDSDRYKRKRDKILKQKKEYYQQKRKNKSTSTKILSFKEKLTLISGLFWYT